MRTLAPPDLAERLRDLESPDDEVRSEALRALAQEPRLSCLRAIRRVAVADSSATLRQTARQILASLADRSAEPTSSLPADSAPQDRYRQLLAASEPEVRVAIVRHLALRLDPFVPTLLLGRLREESDPFVLGALLTGIVAVAGPKALVPVAEFLEHADPRVRAAAVEALMATGVASVLPRLLPLLSDPHHRVRAAAAAALRSQEREAVLACVDGMLRGADDLAARAALYVLRFFEESIAVPRLEESLGKGSPEARSLAAASLSVLAHRGSEAALEALARTDMTRGITPASDASDERISPLAVPVEEDLASGSPEIRTQGIVEAIRLERSDLVDQLLGMLTAETHPRVRATLLTALGHLAGPEKADMLTPYLTDPEPRVRANAAVALGRLAPDRIPLIEATLGQTPHHRVLSTVAVLVARVDLERGLEHVRHLARSGHMRSIRAAIWAATAIGTRGAAEILVEIYRAGDPDLRNRVLIALDALAPTVPSAGRAAERVRERETSRTGVVPLDDAQRERLLFDLTHDSPAARRKAIERIGLCRDPRLLEGLYELLRDVDPEVRHAARTAAHALLHNLPPMAHPDPSALNELSDALKAGGEVARSALDGLARLAIRYGTVPVARVLVDHLPLTRDDSVLRASLASALALVGDGSSVEKLRPLLEDADARVRANVVDALELAGTDADVVRALPLLVDPDPRVRAAVARAAARISREQFRRCLQDLLTSSERTHRAAALHALRTTQADDRFDLLRIHLSFETDPQLLAECAQALAREYAAGHRKQVSSLRDELPPGPRKVAVSQAVARLEDLFAAASQGSISSLDVESDEVTPLTSEQIIVAARNQRLTQAQLRRYLRAGREPLVALQLLKMLSQSLLPDSVELAAPYMHHEDRRVRLSAIEIFVAMPGPESEGALAVMVQDRDREIATLALQSLGRVAREKAFSSIEPLIRHGKPPTVRRGLELLEALADVGGLWLVIETLKREPHSSWVELQTRLILAWAGDDIFDRLKKAFPYVRRDHRTLVREIAMSIGQGRGMPPSEVLEGFDESLVHEPEDEDLGPLIPPQTFREKLAAHAKGVSFALATIVAFIVISSPFFLATDDESGKVVRRPAATREGPRPLGPLVPAPVYTSEVSYEDALNMALAGNRMPTVEDVALLMEADLAAKGIRSKVLVRILALGRCDHRHLKQSDIAEAAFARRDLGGCMEALEKALSELDPDHWSARLSLLRSMVALVRKYPKAGDSKAIHERLDQAEKDYLAIWEKACIEGGVDPKALEELKQELAKTRQLRNSTRQLSEVFALKT